MDRESYGTHGGKFCSSYTAVAVLTRRRVHLCRYACSSVLTVECQYTQHTHAQRGAVIPSLQSHCFNIPATDHERYFAYATSSSPA